MSSPSVILGSCMNCGTPLTDAFCPKCGQKVQPFDPTAADFLHDFTHEMLHVDGKIFRSVGTLLVKPGVLTKDYFEGRRTRWVSPIRLYLVFSLAYFAFITLDNQPGDATEQARSRAALVLVPVFAWLVSLVAAKRMNFPKHLYFSMHLHAAWFAAWFVREAGGWVLSPRFMNSTRWLGGVMVVYSIVYAVLAYRKAYDESWWKSLMKMTAVFAAYLFVITLVTLAAAYLSVSI